MTSALIIQLTIRVAQSVLKTASRKGGIGGGGRAESQIVTHIGGLLLKGVLSFLANMGAVFT